MASLIVKAYPTKLVFGAADHTYVQCGAGARGWKCFGGKAGGKQVRRGNGSTRRADAIATKDESAGLACYAINGVCHQAANRILLPASITVEGARGYGVSQGLFGTYGRVGVFPCKSPFEKHSGVSGDLSDCRSTDADDRLESSEALTVTRQADARYVEETIRLYDEHADLFEAESSLGAIEAFHVELFAHMIEFKLGPLLDDALRSQLLDIRRDIEGRFLEIDQRHAAGDLSGAPLADAVNGLAVDLQEQVAAQTSDAQYESLFGLRKSEVVFVIDPEILAYG